MIPTLEILLIEGREGPRREAVSALSQPPVDASVRSSESSAEALDWLQRGVVAAGAPLPNLILVDAELPDGTAAAFTRIVKGDARLASIPVIAYATKAKAGWAEDVYAAQINCAVETNARLPELPEVLEAIKRFWCQFARLPRVQIAQIDSTGPSRERAGVPAESSGASAGSIRVLMLEDNPTDVMLLRDTLASHRDIQFRVESVARVSEARQRLVEERFDVLLADLGLPDSQGLETVRRARELASDLPVIVLTALDDEAAGVNALHEGAEDYIVKGEMTGDTIARSIRYAIERKGLQERLRHAQRMESVGQLASGIAHDFNNLLTIIQGHLSLLALRGTHDPHLLDSLREIHNAADRAGSLTQQLLAYSRRRPLKTVELDLNEILGRTAKMLGRLLGEATAMTVEMQPGLPALLGDASLIEQAIVNLAVNARDAMPEGGRLSLRTSNAELSPSEAVGRHGARAGRFVCLSVTDTGSGIPTDVIPRIFEPFFTTKDLGRGTGLGLALVDGVVRQHHGWISVTSQPGRGTTFDLYFPACDSPAPSSNHDAGLAENRFPGGTETILLVEDEPMLRRVVEVALQSGGYAVLSAADGEQALDHWKQAHGAIDLVVTDMILPKGLSGRRVVETLRMERTGLRAVFTTGYCDERLLKDLPEGDAFLQKPYTLQNLMQSVRHQLDLRV